jgi:hypothetical protein
MYHKYFRLIILTLSCSLAACGSSAVKPWQKKDLARPEMQFNSGTVESIYKDHFYFSKEGSSGGRGFAGGGCGCN